MFAHNFGCVIRDGIVVHEASVERISCSKLRRLGLHQVFARRIVQRLESCESCWNLDCRPVRERYANKVLVYRLDIDELGAKQVSSSLS